MSVFAAPRDWPQRFASAPKARSLACADAGPRTALRDDTVGTRGLHLGLPSGVDGAAPQKEGISARRRARRAGCAHLDHRRDACAGQVARLTRKSVGGHEASGLAGGRCHRAAWRLFHPVARGGGRAALQWERRPRSNGSGVGPARQGEDTCHRRRRLHPPQRGVRRGGPVPGNPRRAAARRAGGHQPWRLQEHAARS